MNSLTILEIFVWILVLVKILFVSSSIIDIILSKVLHVHSTNLLKLDERMKSVREISESLFTVGISMLLIYHFRPKWWRSGDSKHTSVLVSREETFLFYMFGWILIVESLSESVTDYLEVRNPATNSTKLTKSISRPAPAPA